MPKRGRPSEVGKKRATSLSDHPITEGCPEWWDPAAAPAARIKRESGAAAAVPDHRDPWRWKGPRGSSSARGLAFDRLAASPLARQSAQPLSVPSSSSSSSRAIAVRSIYAVASEESLELALAQAPPALRTALACRVGLWGGLVHMTLCSFAEHRGVDLREAAEAMCESAAARMRAKEEPPTRLRLPAERWSWGQPAHSGTAYAGRHILVCNLIGGSDSMGDAMRVCGQRGLKGTRCHRGVPSSRALHVTLPLEGASLPVPDDDIRAFLAGLEWELAVVRLEGPKAAATPLSVEFRKAIAP